MVARLGDGRVWNRSKGSLLAERLERALHPWQRLRGLLGRRTFLPGEALWIEPCRSVHTFFMRFAIDVLFLDGEGRVVEAIRELRPYRATRFFRRAVGVLELPAGTIAASGTEPGDRIDLSGAETQR